MDLVMKWVFPAATALALVLGVTAITAGAEKAPAAEKPATTQSEGTGTISGELLDEAGKPVAGAKVMITKAVRRDQKRQRKEARPDAATSTPHAAPRKRRAPAERVATATTEDDGKFAVKDVPAGHYTVRAQLKRGGSAVARVTVTAGKAAEVAMTLKPRTDGKSASGKRDLTPEEQAEREQRRQERKAAKKAAKSQA